MKISDTHCDTHGLAVGGRALVFVDPPYDLCFADNLNFKLFDASDIPAVVFRAFRKFSEFGLTA